MRVCISRAVLAEIDKAARANPEQEICGLLLGRGDHIKAFRKADNVAEDPARRFEIDPLVLIGAHRRARDGELAVLGHYHSHPTGDTCPSPCDAEAAVADGSIWLICAPGGHHALWVAGNSGMHDRFEPCEAVYTD